MTITYNAPIAYSDPAFNYDGTREPSSGAPPHEPRLPFTYKRKPLTARGETSIEVLAQGRVIVLGEASASVTFAAEGRASQLVDAGHARYSFDVESRGDITSDPLRRAREDDRMLEFLVLAGVI